jgi:hypothetical protein
MTTEGPEISMPVLVPDELQADFVAWERLSDEAWQMIEAWEKEDAS